MNPNLFANFNDSQMGMMNAAIHTWIATGVSRVEPDKLALEAFVDEFYTEFRNRGLDQKPTTIV